MIRQERNLSFDKLVELAEEQTEKERSTVKYIPTEKEIYKKAEELRNKSKKKGIVRVAINSPVSFNARELKNTINTPIISMVNLFLFLIL